MSTPDGRPTQRSRRRMRNVWEAAIRWATRSAEPSRWLRRGSERRQERHDTGDIGMLRTVIIEEFQRVHERLDHLEIGARPKSEIAPSAGRAVELNQLRHETTEQLSNLKHAAHEEAIKRLEVELARSNENLAAAKEEMGKQQREIERLDNENKERKKEHEEQKREIEKLRTELLNHKMYRRGENTRIENGPSGDIHQMTGSRNSTNSALLNSLGPSTGTSNIADVIDLIKTLNTNIDQAACLIPDSFSYRQSPLPSNSKELENMSQELIIYVGPWLFDYLRNISSDSNIVPDLLISRVALQSVLAIACNRISNNDVPLVDGVMHGNMPGGQANSSETLPNTTVMSQSANLRVNRKYLTGILLKTIMTMGGMQEGDSFSPQHNKAVNEIVKKSLEIRKLISEDQASMELMTYTVPPGAEFDPSRMEQEESGSGKVLFTLEMGLQCKKRRETGPKEEWDVVMKAKVVLESTLEPWEPQMYTM